MKHIWIRSQLVFVSVILFLTLGMTMALVTRFNHRLDLTKEKIYSLSPATVKILKEMQAGKIEVLIFYPHEDPSRANLEMFLKECQLKHPYFVYNFYDPDRVPTLAKYYKVKDQYTVIIKFGKLQERIVGPTEQNFTNALLRLAKPKQYQLCFVTGHGEALLTQKDRTGYQLFNQGLEEQNYVVQDIILTRGQVPEECNAVVVAGPHREFDPQEFEVLRQAYKKGLGVFFLIDPMDPGGGLVFSQFLQSFGVEIGQDVIVDKMSRMVGGDFLVPLINQYVAEHPITEEFAQPLFLPVTRSVQPTTVNPEGAEVVPLALSGSGSWAENDLTALEKGEAAFDSERDVAGPICVGVALEDLKKELPQRGRMVVMGDSDFLTNAYIDLSGNREFAYRVLQWLIKEDRFITVAAREPEFKPLFLNAGQRMLLLFVVLGAIPLTLLLLGIGNLMYRKRTS